MNLFQKIRRRFALKKYIKTLGRELVRRFGKRKSYSPEHVLKAAHARALDPEYLPYAYAMFCSRETYAEYAEKLGDLRPKINFDGLRAEVGDRFFGGSTAFEADGVIDAF